MKNVKMYCSGTPESIDRLIPSLKEGMFITLPGYRTFKVIKSTDKNNDFPFMVKHYFTDIASPFGLYYLFTNGSSFVLHSDAPWMVGRKDQLQTMLVTTEINQRF